MNPRVIARYRERVRFSQRAGKFILIHFSCIIPYSRFNSNFPFYKGPFIASPKDIKSWKDIKSRIRLSDSIRVISNGATLQDSLYSIKGHGIFYMAHRWTTEIPR